jgi:hypothetical protein
LRHIPYCGIRVEFFQTWEEASGFLSRLKILVSEAGKKPAGYGATTIPTLRRRGIEIARSNT